MTKQFHKFRRNRSVASGQAHRTLSGVESFLIACRRRVGKGNECMNIGGSEIRVYACVGSPDNRRFYSPNIRPARHIVAANSNPYMSNPRLLHSMYICMVRLVAALIVVMVGLKVVVLALGTDWRWTRKALTTGTTG